MTLPLNGDQPAAEVIDAVVDGLPTLRRPARQRQASVDLSKLDRLPPHSIESEQGVLGCILLSPRECLDRLPGLKIGPESFYDLRHETLLHAFLAMDHAHRPIDLITVHQYLKDENQLEGIGGAAYLSGLMDAVPSAANLPAYAETVREKRIARRVGQIATDALFKLHDTQPEALLAQVEHDITFLARGRSEPLPAPSPFLEWINAEQPERPLIIHGLLRRGDKLLFGGSSKAGKTWLTMQAALAVASGTPFLGKPTVKNKTLYINLELHADSCHERFRWLCAGLKIPASQVDMTVWNLRKQRPKVEEIRQRLERLRDESTLIVIDPMYKLLGHRVENAAEDMADLMAQFEMIADRNGGALFIPAHFSKGNQSDKSAIDRISGSGVPARDADNIVSLTELEDDDTYAVEFKSRAFEQQPKIAVRWKFPMFRVDDDLDPEKLRQKQTKAGRPPASRDAFLNLITDEGMTNREIVAIAVEKMQISSKTAQNIFQEQLGKNIHVKAGSGHPPLFVRI